MLEVGWVKGHRTPTDRGQVGNPEFSEATICGRCAPILGPIGETWPDPRRMLGRSDGRPVCVGAIPAEASADSAGGPRQGAAAENVHVQVGNAFASVGTMIDHDAETLRQVEPGGELCCGEE